MHILRKGVLQQPPSQLPGREQENARKVTSIDIYDVKLAATAATQWNPVVVRINTDEGIYGLGEVALAYGVGAPAGLGMVKHLAERFLIGADPFRAEQLWDEMYRRTFWAQGGGPVVFGGMSAIDEALWDIKGKALGVPVYELLGGKVRDRIFAYATGNDTDWQLELGFKAVKLACPYGPADGLWGLDENEKLVAKTRELVGDQVEIMLDCYMAFDVEYTVRLAERLRPYQLRWIEEYLIPEDLDGHMAVRRRLPWQTLATGEHMYTPWPFRQLIVRGAVDILQPDIFWVGGLTACRRIAQMADAAGLTVILHGGGLHPFGQHLTVAMPNMPWAEFFIASPPGVPLEEMRRIPGTRLPVDGWLTVNDGPGFGMDIPEEWLEPFEG